MLATIPDPAEVSGECNNKDRARLRLLDPLTDRDHVGWAKLDGEGFRRGTSALGFLTDT